MASHFKLYDGMNEIIPFNARYSYPTQANRAWKSLIKIPPKNGSTFSKSYAGAGSSSIHIELPAQGYMNPGGSFLQFDIKFTQHKDSQAFGLHLQNNAQSWIQRARWVYGSLAGEDIRGYNKLVRRLTEATGTNNTFVYDQTTLTEGVGGIRVNRAANGAASFHNVRLTGIQSTNMQGWENELLQGAIIDGTRRYQCQLALGLFQQPKLIPLKWMASQVAIQLELADFAECIACVGIPHDMDSYEITNVNFIAELYEFDGTYDAAFMEGLRGGGVPIKFASWDTFSQPPSGSDKQMILIPERNRSLKAIFAFQTPPARAMAGPIPVPKWETNPDGSYIYVDGKRKPVMTKVKDPNDPTKEIEVQAKEDAWLPWDSHAAMESTAQFDYRTGRAKGYIKNFQWRIGGKYYPSQPVVCGDNKGTNGGVEAYQEYAKALNIVGDFRLSTAINTYRWCRAFGKDGSQSSCIDWWGSEQGIDVTYNNIDGPSEFVMAADLETSRGNEVSGLNGEEQNDIALMIEYNGNQGLDLAGNHANCMYDIFVYYDVLLVLRENNLVELIK